MAWRLRRRERDEVPPPEDIARWDVLTTLVLQAFNDVVVFYLQLEPGGRALDSEEADEARARLLTAAEMSRACDVSRDLIERFAESVFDLRPSIRIVQSAARSLVLALSDSPEVRAEAIGREDLGARFQAVHESWAPLIEAMRENAG